MFVVPVSVQLFHNSHHCHFAFMFQIYTVLSCFRSLPILLPCSSDFSCVCVCVCIFLTSLVFHAFAIGRSEVEGDRTLLVLS